MRTIPRKLLLVSRSLRKNQTPWEAKLWAHLRAGRFFNLKFKRQVRLGNYVVDFYCAQHRLVIELDGGQHNERKISLKDGEKQEYLGKEGFKVLRFWNHELQQNLGGVLEAIKIKIEVNRPDLSPNLSPRQGRGV